MNALAKQPFAAIRFVQALWREDHDRPDGRVLPGGGRLFGEQDVDLQYHCMKAISRKPAKNSIGPGRQFLDAINRVIPRSKREPLHGHRRHPRRDPRHARPRHAVPDPQVQKEFGVTAMSIWR